MSDRGGTGDLEAILDECCERVLRGEPLEECLLDYPAYREDLARLVPLSSRVAALASGPPAGFAERLEVLLLAEVDAARARREARPWWRGLPLVRPMSLALMLALILGGTGMGVVQAADRSLPDSPLYRVKTVREWAETRLARTDEAVADAGARQVAARDREMEETVRQRKPREVMEALARRVVETTEPLITRALAEAAAGNRRPAQRGAQQLSQLRERVSTLAQDASPEVAPVFRRIESYLAEQEARLRRAAGQGGATRPDAGGRDAARRDVVAQEAARPDTRPAR